MQTLAENSTRESRRVLEPVERISEVLFGLIIVLTFTCSFSATRVGRGEVHAMLISAIGCSLAWGIIDAVFFLLGCISERGHNLLLLRQLHRAADPDEARRAIASVLPPLIASNLQPAVFDSLRQKLSQLPELPARPRLAKEDWQGALCVFLLGFGSVLPIVIPFIFMNDAKLALWVSHGIAIFLLFLAGYVLGHHASERPLRVGVAMVVLGSAMVGIAVALGG